jgi:ferredoxin-type protein NapH
MLKEKRRQKIRRTILLIMFLLFPIIYYYFSPYLIIVGASEGVINGSFIVFGSMFIISLFLGRAFCGWVCPAGGEQELCVRLRDKRFKGGKGDWIKYFLWVPWLSIIALMFYNAGGIKSINFLYQTYYGISIQNIESLILFMIIAGIIALLALIAGKRGFCHTACWMAPFMIIGRKIRNIIRLPALCLKADKEKCIDCKTCSENCTMSLDVNKMVKRGDMENTECILCGTCVDVCPNKVIKFS